MKQKTTKKLPIELRIFTSHRLAEEFAGEGREIEMKAAKCAFMAEGLFLTMAKVCKNAAFADLTVEEHPMPETLMLGLAHMAELGVALMTACTEYIDQLEISGTKAKSKGGEN